MENSKKPRQSELFERLKTFFDETARPGQTLLVGLSGGLDSCVLLHALVAAREHLSLRLKALHVNHGISPNAALWAEFCETLCRGYDVPFSAVAVDVPRDSGLGIEAAAREARYRVLLAEDADAVVLAHHRDDQAETLLLQLLRGAGIKGLAAMPARSEGTPAVWRPLLDVSRRQLHDYAMQHGLQWIEDESNLDLAYDRNFLRHRVLPAMAERFPACGTTLARSAAHFAEAAELLDEVAADDAVMYVGEDGLAIEGLRTLSPARGRNLLRYWLSQHLPALPNTRRLHELYRQLLTARQDAQLRVAVEGGEVRRYRGHARVARNTGAAPMHASWQGEAELVLPNGVLTLAPAVGQGLAAAKVGGRLEIRSRSGGEHFRPDARRPTRSLRHLMQECGMPPWERSALPLIYAGDALVAVPGIGVAAEFQAAPGEGGWLIAWQRR
jgi:tRNA(Ile)-lysidine synthase